MPGAVRARVHPSGPVRLLLGVVAAALFLGAFDGGLPRPVHAEVALAAAPLAPGLCFNGPGGELLDFAPAGRGCR